MQRGGLAPSCYRPSNDQPDEAGALHALLNMLYMVKISPPPVALCVMALSASLIRRPHLHLGDLLPDHLRVAHLRAAASCCVWCTKNRVARGQRAERGGGRAHSGNVARPPYGRSRRRARRPRARDRAGYDLNKILRPPARGREGKWSNDQCPMSGRERRIKILRRHSVKRATPHAARGQRKTAVTRRLTTQARPTRGGSVHAPSGWMSGDQRGALAKRKGIEATSDLRHLTDLTDS